LLLKDENNEVINKHVKLTANYNDVKEKELSLIRETFIRNPTEFTISIIMPTYNRHQYIRHAIESVMNQTFRDFEIIVVNDGGSRECEAVIESFQSDKIRYLYVEHGGLSHALNQGLLASRSKYIAYLDDDDQYFPDHLQSLVSALESSYSFVYADAYREVKIYKDDKWNRISRAVEFSYDFDSGRFAESNYIPVLCMAHRRDCFESIGLFERDLPNAMDWDLWAKAARLYDFKHLKKVTCVYEYRLGPDSLSGRQLDNLFFGTILRKHHLYLAKQVWSDLINRADRGLMGYAEIESRILRYYNDKYQLSEWLLPLAFAKGEWHSAFSLITKMTRHDPSEAFSTLRRLSPTISNLAQLFSFFIFLLIKAENELKHWSRKAQNRRGKN
jgi:glycosyltransferase involved in cell wall biosynthesis